MHCVCCGTSRDRWRVDRGDRSHLFIMRGIQVELPCHNVALYIPPIVHDFIPHLHDNNWVKWEYDMGCILRVILTLAVNTESTSIPIYILHGTRLRTRESRV
jgi:hypothetical protein